LKREGNLKMAVKKIKPLRLSEWEKIHIQAEVFFF